MVTEPSQTPVIDLVEPDPIRSHNTSWMECLIRLCVITVPCDLSINTPVFIICS